MEELITQDNLLKRISLQAHKHSYFGGISFIVGLIEVANSIEEAWGSCILPGIRCDALPKILDQILGKLVWGMELGELLFCNIFPILGLILGLVGLLVDRKKVFSILGLALMFVSFIIYILIGLYLLSG